MLRTALGQIPLIAWICAGIVSTLVIADILAFSLMDIQLDVASLIPYLCAEVGLLVLVAYYVCFRDEPFLRDTLLAAYLTLAFTHAYSPLMYALATVAMPLQDDILLSFDVLIGVDVPSVALWAQDHP
ncbi:MAG: hypothetical protein GWP91_11555, partial [Rhodobacterales bacterium]|nr:hypothetical protein [Rhodobacterales bacterium]